MLVQAKSNTSALNNYKSKENHVDYLCLEAHIKHNTLQSKMSKKSKKRIQNHITWEMNRLCLAMLNQSWTTIENFNITVLAQCYVRNKECDFYRIPVIYITNQQEFCILLHLVHSHHLHTDSCHVENNTTKSVSSMAW